jgi:hypothetical protein
MHVKEYFSALFHDWVGKMSGLASVILLFLPLIFPHAFSDSHTLEHATWIAAFVCFVVANYHVYVRQRKLIATKDAEIERISKPDKCPVVRVYGWSENHGQAEEGSWGFWLQSEGETAHEVTLADFEIEPSVTVAGRMVPHIIGHEIGQAFMPAWIRAWTSADKWRLAKAFATASEKKDGIPGVMTPNYCRTLRLVYRDRDDFWYRTTQEIAFNPSDPNKINTFEFGPIKHEKIGLTKPK